MLLLASLVDVMEEPSVFPPFFTFETKHERRRPAGGPETGEGVRDESGGWRLEPLSKRLKKEGLGTAGLAADAWAGSIINILAAVPSSSKWPCLVSCVRQKPCELVL